MTTVKKKRRWILTRWTNAIELTASESSAVVVVELEERLHCYLSGQKWKDCHTLPNMSASNDRHNRLLYNLYAFRISYTRHLYRPNVLVRSGLPQR